MKNNVFKYIFFIIIIILIIISVVKINIDKNNNNSQKQNIETIVSDENKPTELDLGIAQLDNINPILSRNKNVQSMSKLVFEPLVNLTKDYKAEPCLATEWAKTDDGYIIKLRQNVKWSNGDDFTANDVKFTIDKLKEINSIYTYNVAHVRGIQIADDYTIKILLDSNIPFFEYNLTFPIMSAQYYEGEDFTSSNKNNLTIGTGMYKISDVKDGKIFLDINANWWNNQNAKFTVKKITINLYSSVGEMYNAFKIGNIDLLGITNMDYQQYIGTIGYNSKEYTGREHTFIAINTQSDILKNTEVRRAISLCVDKNNIVSNNFANKSAKSGFPLDYGNWLCNDVNTNTEYNPNNVGQILSQAGWEYRNNNWQKLIDKKTKKVIVNLVVKSSNMQLSGVADTVKSQLEEQGMIINVIKANDRQYENYLKNKNYDMILCNIELAPSPNLTTYFGDNNLANYYTDETSLIMQEFNNTTDENIVKEKFKRLVEIYKTEVPYISICTNKNTVVYSTNLAGEIEANWFNLFYNVNTWYK